MNPALQALLGGGGIGDLALKISNAVNGSGNGTPGGTAASSAAALTGGPPAPTPKNPNPERPFYMNPLVLGVVALIGLAAAIAALSRRG